ncbi:MAG: DNA repair protein RecN, partial [Bacteroidales bacterium]|nr:DNA repair protein RecN [Bacteroidales bacterium]
EEISALLDEYGADSPDSLLIVRRVISRSGRSRSFVNDCPVPLQLLTELSAQLFDIHSQHNSLLLTDRSFQMSVLDSFAGATSLRKECSGQWRRMLSARSELDACREELDRSNSQREWNEAMFSQLEEASLREGELEELEEEQKLLTNAGQIKETLAGAVSLLEGDDNQAVPGPVSAVRESARLLSRISSYMGELPELEKRLDSVRIELDDISSSLESLGLSVNVSQQRLAEVEERLSLLYSLMQKHSCRTVSELIAKKEEFSEALFDTARTEERIKVLEKELSEARGCYDALAAQLSALRKEAASRFSASIESSLHYLELERSVFRAELGASPEGAWGKDSLQFLFSATGGVPADVKKCVSGGEMSRIMLALKALMASNSAMPTLIFDEIDSGVSGSAADRMGSMICSMGKDMQVLAITHLPQVAAKGDAHFAVVKTVLENGRAVSSIKRIGGRERTMEIARLLSGAEITPEAVANAEALLGGR